MPKDETDRATHIRRNDGSFLIPDGLSWDVLDEGAKLIDEYEFDVEGDPLDLLLKLYHLFRPHFP